MAMCSTCGRGLVIGLLWAFMSSCLALDNPDAPDYVAEFKARAQVYESKIHGQAGTTLEYVDAYGAYEAFLDKELNQAYQALMGKLDRNRQKQLRQAQRAWLKYRQAELDFIAVNWTRQEFGSSAALSRGGYRTALLKDRVIALLHYLKNYP